MARKIIDIGVQGNDGTGDSIREAFRKVNDNFKDIYAIFGSDEEVLSTKLLDDFPAIYSPNTVLITDSDGERVLGKTLEALDASIIIDNTNSDKITFKATGGKLIVDSRPQLGGSLDGLNNVIANVADPDDFAKWNIDYASQNPITADDVVITKGYADKRYIQAIGAAGSSISGSIRLRDEPDSPVVHIQTLGDPPVNDGRIFIPNHGFNLGSNGAAFTYASTGSLLGQLAEEITAGQFVALRTYKIKVLGNTDWNAAANTTGKTYRIGDLFTAATTGNTTIPSGQVATGKAEPVYFIRFYNSNYLNLYYKIDEAKEVTPDSSGNNQNNRILITPSADTICTGSINSTTLTISGITSGLITIGSKVTGCGIAANTIITGQIGPYTGLAGTYTVTPSQILTSTSLVIKSIHTFSDAYYNSTLTGNYLSNEALPRKNVVRRQGDTMTGPLYLSDHPAPLAGSGSPNGADDLQAATKFYVDNSSFSSDTNLYVSNSGDDTQGNVPVNKKGSALAYAFASIKVACERAENMIELSSNEPGPYRQKIYYTLGATQYASVSTEVEFASGNWGQPWAPEFKILLERNIEWIKAETISYVNITDPTLVYNQELCSRDIELMLNAAKIDMIADSNWQSINAGRNYFKNSSAIIASTTQKQSTLNAINRVIECLDEALNNNSSVSSSFTSYQDTFSRYQVDGAFSNVTSQIINDIIAKINIIKNIIDNYQTQGSASHSIIDYGTGVSLIKFTNGGVGADQGLPTNIDIIPGKILRGITSGATGRITDYVRLAGTGVDHIRVTLLSPIEFVVGEELEFAESNKNLQITILVESGIYLEDLPIRVPPNVTIRGNDFRRCIVRPKNKTSSSPWIETYFYRDSVFDGLDLLPTNYPYAITLLTANKEFLKREIIGWINTQISTNTAPFTSSFTYNQGKCSRDVGLIIDALIHDIKFGGNGESYTAASLYWNGVISKIGASVLGTSQIDQTAAAITKLKDFIITNILTNTTFTPYQTGITQVTNSNNGETPAITKATSLLTSFSTVVSTGLSALSSSFGAYDSPKYGYHYLKDGTLPLNVGPSYTNVGGFVNAAYMIEINRQFIQKEVVEFIEALYPSFTFSSSECEKDVVKICNALINDLKKGNRVDTIDVAASFYESGSVKISSQYKAGMQYIATLITAILNNPDQAIPTTGLDNVNTAKKRNSTVSQLLDDELEIETDSVSTVGNLISSVVYALESTNYTGSNAYNPPKNSNEVDMFLFNDAVRISNITGQGHGGFMCVLDPAGAIGSKSPYVQESACFSASVNKQAFRGGMFIDGFSGRLTAAITNVSPDGLTLTLSGLTKRRPLAPTAFYYNGFRYQIDNILSWNTSGVCEIELNATTPWSNGNLQIILETPGNRSMLANDYTQVNDLGYGIVAHNAGLTEQVSTFTYYCHTAYFASNGGQIRSVAGSNANGNFGLRAAGADPTELPDQVALSNDQVQPLKIYRYGDFSYTNLENSILIYAKRYSYIPESVSELEIEHSNGDSSRYEVRSISKTGLSDNQYKYRITDVDISATPVKIKLDAYQVTANGIAISAVGRTDPCLVTTGSAHNLVSGDFVSISGIKGMTQLNGGSYYVKVTSSTQFEIYKDSLNAPIDSTLYNTYISDGIVTLGLKFYAGDMLYLDGLVNSVELNRRKFLAVPTSTFNQAELYTDNKSGSLTSLTAGKLYTINTVGTTDWNAQAGTVDKTYVKGSTFIASSSVTIAGGSTVTSNNSFLGSIEGTSLTISTLYFGTLSAGQYLIGPNVKKGTKIVSGSGSNWTVNISQTVSSGYFTFYQGLSNSAVTAFGAGTGIHNGGSYVTNRQYMITTTGSFTSIGSATNNILTHFVATGSGTDGSAYYGGWAYEQVKYEITDVSSTSPAIVTFSEPVNFENGDLITISDTNISLINNTNYVRRGGSIIVSSGNFVPGEQYKIVTQGTTSWTEIGAANNNVNTVFVATGTGDSATTGRAQLVTLLGPTQVAVYTNETLVTNLSLIEKVSAGNFVVGKIYKIVKLGVTDFTLLGAVSNTVGILFTATGSGTSVTNSGEAFLQSYQSNSTSTNATSIAKGDLYSITSANNDLITLGADLTPSTGEVFQAISPGTVLGTSSSTVQLLGSAFAGKEILKLSLATNAADNRSGTGLTDQTSDHTNAAIRILQNMRFNGIENVNPTRPSTALELDAYGQHLSQSTLRIIAYVLTGSTGDQLPDNIAILTTDQTFNYVKPNSRASALSGGYGSAIGDTKIAVDQITTGYLVDLLNTGTLLFSWAGKVHRITSYTDQTITQAAYISFTDVYDNNNIPGSSGLGAAIPTDGTRVFRAGLPAGSSGAVTIKISTCRATGHDFLDIGTGGFNTSNYPTAIYGNPSIEPSDAYEIKEETKGRVFYVTSDQDGVFKVGPYFKVDQGTGTVTFAASIALSNLDGLGFKRGVTVSEFSTDNTMTNNAADTVPTQQAIRGYIDKRLGIDHNGTNVPVANKIGPGFLPLNGQNSMESNLVMAGNYITGLGTPGDSNTSYAATVGYVQSKLNINDEFEELKDVIVRYGETLTKIGSASGTVLTTLGLNTTELLFVDVPIRLEVSVGNLSANKNYFVVSIINSTTFTVSATKRGTPINVGTVSSIDVDVYKVLTGQLAVFLGANNAVSYADIKGDIYSRYTADGITTLRSSIATDPDPEVNQDIVDGGVYVYDVSGFVDNNLIFGNLPGTAPKNYFQINNEIFSYTGVTDDPVTPAYPKAGILTGVERAVKQSSSQSHLVGDSVIPLNSARLDFQIASEVIVDADVSPTAGIVQSKLSMNSATTRANANSITQADRGLASFDSNTFTASSGWISITNGSITYSKIQNVDSGSILGNLTPDATSIQQISPENVLKRATWNTFNTSSTDDTNYAFTFIKAGSGVGNENNFISKHLISTTGENNAIVKTNSSGGIQVAHVKTNDYQNSAGSSLITASGTNVTYYGAWSAGSGASLSATYATSAGSATTAGSATYATSAGSATTAGSTTTVTTGGSVTTTVISSGGSSTAGTVTGDWTLTTGSKWQATYADLAEYYTSDQEYEPGTVLVFGGTVETTTTKTFGDSRVAGVVTTNPAYTMNAGLEGLRVCIALQGRVPCKVVGKVRKGDLLTTSAISGHAAKAVNPQVGTIIGKALEDKDYDQAGVIEVAVGRV